LTVSLTKSKNVAYSQLQWLVAEQVSVSQGLSASGVEMRDDILRMELAKPVPTAAKTTSLIDSTYLPTPATLFFETIILTSPDDSSLNIIIIAILPSPFYPSATAGHVLVHIAL
jgi:hypothetical protein